MTFLPAISQPVRSVRAKKPGSWDAAFFRREENVHLIRREAKFCSQIIKLFPAGLKRSALFMLISFFKIGHHFDNPEELIKAFENYLLHCQEDKKWTLAIEELSSTFSKVLATRKIISEEINRQNGSISFANFMQCCLYSETGYYSSGTVQIADSNTISHFTTLPEHSPNLSGFGLSEHIYKMWSKMGEPEDFWVVEMGAGNGTMAKNILDNLRDKPDLFITMKYLILEISPSLIERQKQKLEQYEFKVHWIRGSAIDIPLGNLTGVVLSNELPDAFPVHILKEDLPANEMKELCVQERDGSFVEALRPLNDELLAQYQLLQKLRGADYFDNWRDEEGARIIPINLGMLKWQKGLSSMLRRGYVITIDYGFYRETLDNKHPIRTYCGFGSNSWRKRDFILNYPGMLDITTDIDFLLLSAAGESQGLKAELITKQPWFFWPIVSHILCGDQEGPAPQDIFKDEFTSCNDDNLVLVQSKNMPESMNYPENIIPRDGN